MNQQLAYLQSIPTSEQLKIFLVADSMGGDTQLIIYWAEHFLDNYQQEIQRNDTIPGILQFLMCKKGFYCDKETFEDIVDYLLINYF